MWNPSGNLTWVQDDMAADGYTEIMSIDYSSVCIDQQKRWHHKPSCKFVVADARNMPQFSDGAFASIIDKGTLDSMLCSATSFPDVPDTLTEVHRLLQPGGRFVVVTYGNPYDRLKHLRKEEHPWMVETFTVEKVPLHQAQGRSDGEGISTLEIRGPFLQEPILQSLEMLDDVVFVYVCTKEIESDTSTRTQLHRAVTK